MTKVFCFVIILSFLGFGSCKKKATDPDYCNTAWATSLQPEITAFTNALATYTNDPTTANCNAYKAAFQDYIDALEPFGNCTAWSAQDKADWEEALADAEAEISTLCD